MHAQNTVRTAKRIRQKTSFGRVNQTPNEPRNYRPAQSVPLPQTERIRMGLHIFVVVPLGRDASVSAVSSRLFPPPCFPSSIARGKIQRRGFRTLEAVKDGTALARVTVSFSYDYLVSRCFCHHASFFLAKMLGISSVISSEVGPSTARDSMNPLVCVVPGTKTHSAAKCAGKRGSMEVMHARAPVGHRQPRG